MKHQLNFHRRASLRPRHEYEIICYSCAVSSPNNANEITGNVISFILARDFFLRYEYQTYFLTFSLCTEIPSELNVIKN